MVSLRRIFPILLAALCVAGGAQAGGRPIVVELFTSQGCSSCPPADALLGRLAQRPGVIAISLPITYWDMLGWKDTLASEANTRRQKAYAAAMGHGGVYTPQIVVDGVVDVVGSRVSQVEAAIADRRAQLAVALAQARDIARVEADAERAADDAQGTPTALYVPSTPAGLDPIVPVELRETPQEMRIDIGAAPGTHNATVWLFQLRSAVSVTIPTGENAGHTITYHNVASDLRAVGVYRGRALSLSLPGKTGVQHDSIAVVVQQGGFGHVLGAAMISRPNYYAEQ
ncbi:MAG TPA: DUF1223 domain-containing protein [Rhizomicrobium sp.]|nr:DUF1223 domain-containing protein [Rhizomicrobium sp.]